MAEEHWFDVTSKAALQAFTRRGIVRSLAIILPGPLYGASATAAAKNKNGPGQGKSDSKGRGKGRCKRKPKSKPPDRCGHAWCLAEWPHDDSNRNDCELKCGRCRNREKFCIVEGNPANPANIATCCFEHQTCCADERSPSGLRCVDTEINSDHCGDCNSPCTGDGRICQLGRCVCASPGGRSTWCGDACVNTKTDRNNCGGCDVRCVSDQDCVAAACRPRFGSVCPEGFGNCYPTGDPCARLKTDDNHCGRCHNRCDGSRHCVNGACVPLTVDDVHFCPAPGGGQIAIPNTFPCCDNNLGYCREGYTCIPGNCVR